jgi:hypothetical protein
LFESLWYHRTDSRNMRRSGIGRGQGKGKELETRICHAEQWPTPTSGTSRPNICASLFPNRNRSYFFPHIGAQQACAGASLARFGISSIFQISTSQIYSFIFKMFCCVQDHDTHRMVLSTCTTKNLMCWLPYSFCGYSIAKQGILLFIYFSARALYNKSYNCWDKSKKNYRERCDINSGMP